MTLRVIGCMVGALLVTSCGRESPPVPPPAPTVRDMRVPTYELQEKCGKDAYDWYKREWEDVPASNMTSHYTNHFNAKLDRCFLVVSSSIFGKDRKMGGTSFSYHKTLLDVLENRELGALDKTNDQPQPYQCEVGGKQCTSADEWDALVKPYMQE